MLMGNTTHMHVSACAAPQSRNANTAVCITRNTHRTHIINNPAVTLIRNITYAIRRQRKRILLPRYGVLCMSHTKDARQRAAAFTIALCPKASRRVRWTLYLSLFGFGCLVRFAKSSVAIHSFIFRLTWILHYNKLYGNSYPRPMSTRFVYACSCVRGSGFRPLE